MTQLQLARNAWHNYNYTECIKQSQPNSNTRHTQTRHGSSTMFCNDEQDLLLLCNNLPHARFIPLRVQCLELTQTQTTSTNRWSTNWYKHYNINTSLYITLHQISFLWWKWAQHVFEVCCQALLVQFLEDIKQSQTHTQTHTFIDNTLKLHIAATWRTTHPLSFLVFYHNSLCLAEHRTTWAHSTNNNTWTRHSLTNSNIFMKLTIHANIASLLQDLVYVNQAWLMQKKVAHSELARMMAMVGSSAHKLDIDPKLQTHMHASNIMHVYAYILCGHMCCLSCVCQALINAIYKHTCKQTIIQTSLHMHIYMYILSRIQTRQLRHDRHVYVSLHNAKWQLLLHTDWHACKHAYRQTCTQTSIALMQHNQHVCICTLWP